MYHYQAYGLSFCSDVELPLPAVAEPVSVDVRICRYSCAQFPDQPLMQHQGVACQWQQNMWSWCLPRMVRIDVRNGAQVDVYVLNAVADTDLVGFLLMPALTALLIQRSRIALLGNAIAYDEQRAFALLNLAPCGKSSLSWLAQQRGWLTVSDGLIVPQRQGESAIAAGFNRIVLQRDMCERFEIDVSSLIRVRTGVEQFYVPSEGCAHSGYRLTHVFVLVPSRVKPQQAILQQGLDTFRLLQRYSAGEPWVSGLQQQAAQFHQLTTWGRSVCAMQLVYRKGIESMELLDQIESVLSHRHEVVHAG